MSLRRLAACFLLASLVPGLAGLAAAGPRDARPGETLAVYKRSGTPIRAEPKTLCPAVTSLASKTRVLVREVRQPWIKVMALDGTKQEGWLRATQLVDVGALSQNSPRPSHLEAANTHVSQGDVNVAGRQFSASVEKQYRQSHPNLQHAYALVDAMEEATRAMDPVESVAFIQEGNLGQAGQDFMRPGRLAPTRTPPPTASRQPARPRGAGGLLGKIPGIGNKIPRELRDGLEAGVQVVPGLFKQLSEKFTPEQEYSLGRAVAANAIAQYGVDPDENRRAYVRKVGEAIVRLSRRLPPNAGGYHFEVLDSDEINGVSGPGGFVLITRGAVKMCRGEDELAAILAHELGHIHYKHGELTLRKGKNFRATFDALAKVGSAAGRVNAQAGKLLDLFTKVVGEMARTSIQNDYGRGAEFQADLEGTYILMDVVYDHRAMARSLGTLAKHVGAYQRSATHAPPVVRAQALYPIMQKYPMYPYGEATLQARRERFRRAFP